MQLLFYGMKDYTPLQMGGKSKLTTCLRCGTTLTLDPFNFNEFVDVIDIHNKWHQDREREHMCEMRIG